MSLTAAGFEARSLATIKAEIEAEIRTNISPTMDLSPSSPMGQLVAITARQNRKVEEAMAALYGAMSPNGAAGAQLDNIASLTGTTREPATKSRVTATVDVGAGTYAIGTLVANVVGRPADRFVNIEEVTGPDAAAMVVFEAEETGPIAATAGTLTEISGPVAGWNGITNAADATLGSDTETDPALRVRRAQEVTAQGSTTVDAIAADISQNIPAVIQVSVLENLTDVVDSNGLLPHSIEAIVFGPTSPTAADDQEVADQIYDSKPAGIGTNGTTTESVETSQGTTQAISFTRPSTITVVADATIETDDDYVGDAQAAIDVATAAAAALGVGDDVNWSDVVEWLMDVTGVIRVTAVGTAVSPGPPVAFTDVAVDIREIGSLSSGDIAITSSAGTP